MFFLSNIYDASSATHQQHTMQTNKIITPHQLKKRRKKADFNPHDTPSHTHLLLQGYMDRHTGEGQQVSITGMEVLQMEMSNSCWLCLQAGWCLGGKWFTSLNPRFLMLSFLALTKSNSFPYSSLEEKMKTEWAGSRLNNIHIYLCVCVFIDILY